MNESQIWESFRISRFGVLLFSGSAGKNGATEAYIDDNWQTFVVSLFPHRQNTADAINECCTDVTNPENQGNMMLYSGPAVSCVAKG